MKMKKVAVIVMVLCIIVLLYIIRGSYENLNEDLMIKLSDERNFYTFDLEYLSFNDVKYNSTYLLIVLNANAIDVRESKDIIKIDNIERKEYILSLFDLAEEKIINNNIVIDFSVIHPVVFVRINEQHFFRIDIFDDFYVLSQDNVISTERYYVLKNETKEKILEIIEKYLAEN